MGTRYGSRYLGIISLGRFLVVEQHCQCRRPVAPDQPRRAPEPASRRSVEGPQADRSSSKIQ
jgi:hypothetical protein